MNQGKRSLPGVAFLDFLANLLMLFLVLFALAFTLVHPKVSRPSIVTPGYYAVVVTWPDGSQDDVDTFVEDPQGNVSWFANPSIGLMHLEQDDLGSGVTNTEIVNGTKVSVKQNSERTVLRGYIAGEYIVNVFLYNRREPGPVKVTVRLYKMDHPESPVVTQVVTLYKNGDDVTPFRFTLNRAGQVTSISHTPKNIALNQLGYGSPVTAPTGPSVNGNGTSAPGAFH